MIEPITREEWDSLTPDEQYRYAHNGDGWRHDLDAILDLIPACPDHGSRCIPYAMSWLRGVNASGVSVSVPDVPVPPILQLDRDLRARITLPDEQSAADVRGSLLAVMKSIRGI